MENVKNVTPQKLSASDMLAELPIGVSQLRAYIKDGRLKAEKVRNKYYATREDFNDFNPNIKIPTLEDLWEQQELERKRRQRL